MEASNRQERLQMRQRGAGTREINTVDFGISFGATPRQSARNTPQPASQRRRSKTPLIARGALRRPSRTPSKEPTTSRTAEDAGIENQTGEPARSELFDVPEGSMTRSRKRRKLSLEQENTQLITPATSQASGPSIGGRRSTSGRRSSALPIHIAEEVQEQQTSVESNHENGGRAGGGSSPEGNKENAVPDSEIKTPQTAGSRRASGIARSSVLSRRSRSTRSSSRQSDNFSMVSATGNVESADEVLVAVLDDSGDESLDDHQEGVSLMTAQGGMTNTTMELVAVLDDTTFNGNETDYHSTIDPSLLAAGQAETTAPRSANIKKKRRSLKSPGEQVIDRSVSEEVTQLSSEISAQQEQPELPTPDETQQQTYPDLPTPTHARSTPHALHPASEDSFYQPNHDEDETYLQPTSPVIPTPKPVPKKAAPRKKKAATKRPRTSTSTSSTSSSQPKTGNRKRKTFPIVTHRLVNTSTLPTITEEDENEDEDNNDSSAETPDATPDATPAPGSGQASGKEKKPYLPRILRNKFQFLDRPTPNAVDVLSQFCREDIEASLESLAANSHPADGEPSNTKLRKAALHAFSDTLNSTLTQLSNLVEHRHALQARVKQAGREKSELQEQWAAVRREREEVQRKLDVARRVSAERREVWEGKRALSEGLFRVGLEVERTGEEEEGVEYKVLKVADVVSNRPGAGGGAGGLLDRVRGMNAVLEGMLPVLEARKRSR